MTEETVKISEKGLIKALVIARIAEEGLMSEDQTRGFLKGNALKCLVRYKDKNGTDDLIKAREYITRLIAFEDGGDSE